MYIIMRRCVVVFVTLSLMLHSSLGAITRKSGETCGYDTVTSKLVVAFEAGDNGADKDTTEVDSCTVTFMCDGDKDFNMYNDNPSIGYTGLGYATNYNKVHRLLWSEDVDIKFDQTCIDSIETVRTQWLRAKSFDYKSLTNLREIALGFWNGEENWMNRLETIDLSGNWNNRGKYYCGTSTGTSYTSSDCDSACTGSNTCNSNLIIQNGAFEYNQNVESINLGIGIYPKISSSNMPFMYDLNYVPLNADYTSPSLIVSESRDTALNNGNKVNVAFFASSDQSTGEKILANNEATTKEKHLKLFRHDRVQFCPDGDGYATADYSGGHAYIGVQCDDKCTGTCTKASKDGVDYDDVLEWIITPTIESNGGIRVSGFGSSMHDSTDTVDNYQKSLVLTNEEVLLMKSVIVTEGDLAEGCVLSS